MSHLINRDQLEQINELLSERAARDAGRTVGLAFIGYGLVALSLVVGVCTNLHYKFWGVGLILGFILSQLSKANIHLNDPKNLT